MATQYNISHFEDVKIMNIDNIVKIVNIVEKLSSNYRLNASTLI